MRNCQAVFLALVVGGAVASAACSQTGADDSATPPRDRSVSVTASDKVLVAPKEDAAKLGQEVDKAAVDIKEAGANLVSQGGDAARDLTERTRDVATGAGQTITDGWITTAVTAALTGDALLKGSRIDVDTTERVVRLKGSVATAEAKARATRVAGRTEGVTRVVNELVIK
jgi:hypothetical protein